MKNFFRILLVSLISANSLACSWYPFGEDVRFSLIDPSLYDDGGMSPYYYTSWNFGYGFTSTPENDPNIALWQSYCKGKVDVASIYEAVYELNAEDLGNKNTQNEMISYLKKNDPAAIEYLLFAKSCSEYNNVYSDWEEDSPDKMERDLKMLEAMKRSKRNISKELSKRYVFLGMRLAFYNKDQAVVNGIYDRLFSSEPTDVIDYWALYFKSTTEENSVQRNFNLAQVFANAPGKRFGALSRFSRKIPIHEVLELAQTNTERANIYLMYATRERGRGLSTLKKVQELDPNHPLLDYLLIREVNKLEDWILTPRYTNFRPSVDPRRESYSEMEELIKERIRDDEKYGRELAEWISTLNTDNKTWGLIEAYLRGISGQPLMALGLLDEVNGDPDLLVQLRIIFKVRAGIEVPLKRKEQAQLMDLKQNNYNLFLFAVSREYEFQNDYTMAAALFSHVNKQSNSDGGDICWKSASGKQTLASDHFYSWFLYLDAEYTPKQVQAVITFAETKFSESTEFDHWQRKYLRHEVDKLYDLLGTKYIRQNNISSAISAFEQVKGNLWNTDPFITYLDANPFHADFYSGHKPSKRDTIRYTKLELAKAYQSYLKKAENPRTKNRAYYYFLIANCEFNMSHHGNSWMMRRYYWTGAMSRDYLEDEDDYFRLKRAKTFYEKAYVCSSNKQTKAFCLRMAGRCEKEQLMFDADHSWDFDYDKYGGFSQYISDQNTAYKKLKKEYPKDADELMSNCFSFERYFAKLED